MKTIISSVILCAAIHSVYGQAQSLTLEQAIHIAQENNLSLQATELDYAISEGHKKVAKSAWMPDLSLNTSYTYFFDKAVIFMPGLEPDGSSSIQDLRIGGNNAFNAQLTLRQSILNPVIAVNSDLAATRSTIQGQVLQQHKNELAYRVGLVFNQLIVHQRVLELMEESIERNARSLADSRNLLATGKGTSLDTVQLYVRLSNVKNEYHTVQENIGLLQLQLKQLMGVPKDSDFTLVGAVEESSADPVLSCDLAVENPEIAIEKLEIQLETESLKLLRATALPSIDLLGAYQAQFQVDDFSGQFTLPRTSFVGLHVNVPILQHAEDRSKIKVKQMEIAKRELEYQDKIDELRLKLESVSIQMLDLSRKIELQESIIDASRTNFQQTSDRFKLGLVKRIELSDAELELSKAELQLHQLKHDLDNNRLLFKLLNGL